MKKSFKLTWWQTSLFKLSTVSFGILLGIFFTDFFASYVPLLFIIVVTTGLYISYVYINQK